jgi:DNA-binding MarR family transcriptional regulator
MDYEAVSPEEAQQVASLLSSVLRGVRTGADDPVVDLPLAQLRLCNVLAEGPRPMSEVSREIGTSLSAVTQIADRLEHAGLIKRVPRADDRRVRCLQLTEQGEKMVQVHQEMRIRRISKVLEQLTCQERRMVVEGLELLVRASGAARGRESDLDGHPARRAISKVLL